VAARAGAEVVALDRALEALADPDAGDFDPIARLEGLDGDGLAFDGAVDRAAELDELAVGADVELLQVAELRLLDLAVLDRVERKLDRVVAVHVLRPDLDDRARAGLDDGDGGDRTRLRVEHLRHAELASENSFCH
jgi:hypothetical protein